MKRWLWLVVACATLPRCSSSSKHVVAPEGDAGSGGESTAGNSAGGGAGGAPSVPREGGSAGSDATSTAGAAATGSGKFGQIIVQWDGTQVSGSALFEGGGALPSGADDPCTTTTIGLCTVRVCNTDLAGPENPRPASAGTVTVTGGSQPLVLTPSPMFASLYDLSSGADATFSAGTQLSVSASGAEVPKFAGHSVTLPSGITVTDELPVIAFDQDLPLTWSGGGAQGTVVFEIESLGDTQIGSLSCELIPASHAATIPKAALALLPPCVPEQGPTCDWTLEPRATTHFDAGDYAIDFSARAAGKTASFTN